MKVYLLWHQCDDDDEGKLIGIFSCRERAERIKAAYLNKPGFKNFPNGFIIDKHDVDKTSWEQGFVTMRY